ncbi:hypothetical protein [Pseudomonas abietaniphila]
MTNKTEMVSVPRELLECARNAVEYLALRGDDVGISNVPVADALRLILAEANREVLEEPVQVVAVAVTREDEDEGLRLEWLLEGGISELEFAGTVLFAMPEANNLCADSGSAELYRRATPPEDVRAVVDEPVADVVMFEGEKIIDGTLAYMATAKIGDRLYRHPQRQMVLPEHICGKDAWRSGWNACLDEISRLNK